MQTRLRFLALALCLLVSAAVPPAALQSSLAEGQALMQKGDLVGAERVFRALTEADDSNGQAWFLLGFALHGQKKLGPALEAHKKAAEFPGLKATASYNAACVLSLQGELDAAFAWIDKAKAAGFQNVAQMATDPDLVNLRADGRFARYVPTKLEGKDLFVEQPRVLLTLEGESAGDEFGWVARNVGDLDADGVDDFVTSSPSKALGGPQAGRIYAYSSKTGRLLFTRDGQTGQRLGNSVAPAGDIDQDGTPDVFIGAPAGGTARGWAYVFSGKDGKTLLELKSEELGTSFGLKVTALGDLDGDGVWDLFVGAPGHDLPGAKDAGRGFGFSGATGKELFVLDGEQAGDQFGAAAEAVTEGPSRLLVVSAMTGGPKKNGKVYVYELIDGFPEPFFTIDADATGKNLGQYFVSIPGDCNGDGVPDVYASDWNNAAKGPSTGRIYVYSGKDGTPLLTVDGGRPGEGFGTSPSQAGDVNGDGCADLIVGAWQNAEVAPSAGKCYLYSGKDGKLLTTYTCRQGGDTFGFDATGLGDVDGDGGLDFLLTSAWSAIPGAKTGRVFVIAGPRFEVEGG